MHCRSAAETVILNSNKAHMKTMICIGYCIILSVMGSRLLAQFKKSGTVKAGSTVNETFSKQELYHYPDFVQGTVYFKDGNSGSSRLNYSLITGEIQFIDGKND